MTREEQLIRQAVDAATEAIVKAIVDPVSGIIRTLQGDLDGARADKETWRLECLALRKRELVWHKWPEEKPEMTSRYLVIAESGHPDVILYCVSTSRWSSRGVSHWAEILPPEDR